MVTFPPTVVANTAAAAAAVSGAKFGAAFVGIC